ncbi:hypothetical protein DN730_17430 [Marinomonas piezotolerans]|uniref:GNAT family N-acetyltransferase n=1 Tax=Marinomonas piezotolerans TaxID=2213058 RepID=A0A370U507_9GAMM|nr:hypothetical protein [Marinomonas piezotolerans]RDL42843.1 hypothetical protein DN730_17430 [Marinomonas piezotolerans]
METDIFTSPLPCVENINNLNFWRSMGIASMLFSCHNNYSSSVLGDCFEHIKHALEQKKAVILFNNENRPVALATYRTYGDVQESGSLLSSEAKHGDVVFDYIISPFSSPLNIYRFLKGYLESHAGREFSNAYLLDHSTGNLRHIW